MPALVVPELAAVVAGALSLMLLLALYLLSTVVSGPFRRVPFVGGSIANGIEGLMRAARDAAAHAFQAVLAAPTQMFKILRTLFGVLHGEIANTISDVLGYAHRIELWLEHRVIPGLLADITNARHWADHLYNVAVRYALAAATDARHWADHLYNVAVRYALAAATDARHWADHLYNAAVAYALAVATDARHWADHLYNVATAHIDAEIAIVRATVSAYALDLFRTAEADLVNGLRRAETLAEQEAAAAEHAAVQAVSAAASAGLAVPWQGIITDVDQLRGIIADSWPDIRDAVDAIPRAVPADLAGVISALGVLAIPMLRAMEDCVLPGCRNLSGLGGVIGALRDGAAAAALLAWVTYCVADPVAAADDTQAAGGPLAQATLGGLEALFGIRL